MERYWNRGTIVYDSKHNVICRKRTKELARKTATNYNKIVNRRVKK